MSWRLYLSNRSVLDIPEPDFMQIQEIHPSRILSLNGAQATMEIQIAFELLDGINGNRLVGPPNSPGSFFVQPLKINTDTNHHLVLVEDEEKEVLAYRSLCLCVQPPDQIVFRVTGAANIPMGVTHYNVWVQNA